MINLSKNNKKRGISLIVLVITIVIMIILAAVIIITISNSGIISKSKTAATDYDVSQIEEAAQVIYSDYLLNTSVADDYSSVGEYIKYRLVEEGIVKNNYKDYIHIDNNGNVTDVKEEVTSADLIIDSIEDLVRFSNAVSSGNTYSGKNIVLAKTLDFTKDSSYEDSTSISFGDINENGTNETLINELTIKTGSAKGFKPIGGLTSDYVRQSRPFSGIFDGLNNEILGIYINRTKDPVGIFGITNNATIKNLGVNGTISGYYNVAGIVSVANGTSDIYNCYNIATLTYKDTNTADVGSIGGVVGNIHAGKIDSCYNAGNIYIYADGANCLSGGGVLGHTGTTTIICNSYNIGNIYRNGAGTTTASYIGFGGIIGSEAGSGGSAGITKIYNSYNLGNITNNYYPTAGILGTVYEPNTVDIKNVYNGIDFSNTSIEQILNDPNSRAYSLSNAYHVSTGTNTVSSATSKTLSEMKLIAFVNVLNENVASYNSANPNEIQWKAWKLGKNGYPTIAY